jgi:hypothetical protein
MSGKNTATRKHQSAAARKARAHAGATDARYTATLRADSANPGPDAAATAAATEQLPGKALAVALGR